MATYFVSFSWGICILLAFVGWGGLINRILFPKHQIDWGQRAAWGIAFSILVGGLLNATSSISRTTVFIYVGSGAVFWFTDLFIRKLSLKSSLCLSTVALAKDPPLLVGTLIVLFLAILDYAGSVFTQLRWVGINGPVFNSVDDLQAYFVYPIKMLQTGSMGQDPFNEKRFTFFGGQSFLDAFVLSALSEKSLKMMDAGIGVLIIIGLLIGYFVERGTPPRRAVCVLLFLLLIPSPGINISSLMIGTALFFSLFQTLDWRDLDYYKFPSRAFIVALITAAIWSLKLTLVPASAVLFLLSYLFFIFGSKVRRYAIKEFVMAALLVALFLLPWMVSMYQSCGTLFYPILGNGYHGSAYGTFQVPFEYLTISKLGLLVESWLSTEFLVFCMLGTSAVWLGGLRPVGRGALMSFLLSGVVGKLSVVLGAAGVDAHRYSFPFISGGILVFMTELLTGTLAKEGSTYEHRGQNPRVCNWLVISALAAGLVVGYGWDKARYIYLHLFNGIQIGLKDPSWVMEEDVAKYKKMQKSIPQGETVLARLERPYVLDFNRNIILISGWPGGASLPSGMPSFRGAEALSDYLVLKSIRYVAYSYASEAGHPKKFFGQYLEPGEHPWIRAYFEHIFDFQDNLEQLGKTRKRIYDDGEIFVLDLLKRQKNDET